MGLQILYVNFYHPSVSCLMKVLNLTDKTLIFFQKSAVARFNHLFLKKLYDQPNFKNFPEINLVTFVLIVVTDLCSRHDSSTRIIF